MFKGDQCSDDDFRKLPKWQQKNHEWLEFVTIKYLDGSLFEDMDHEMMKEFQTDDEDDDNDTKESKKSDDVKKDATPKIKTESLQIETSSERSSDSNGMGPKSPEENANADLEAKSTPRPVAENE